MWRISLYYHRSHLIPGLFSEEKKSCGLQDWIEKEIQASPAAPAPLSTPYQIPLCKFN